MIHERLVEKVKAMSIQERFDSLVRSGIVTADGKLTPQYRDPDDEDDDTLLGDLPDKQA